MALRHTEEGARRLMQRLQEEAEAKRSIAGRMYPHLKTKPTEDDQPKREPIQGWSHLRRK